MTEQAIYGWLITVERPGAAAAPEVYNVAILDERLAIEAVRRVLPSPKEAIVKVKSKLTKPLFDALKMKQGDVMLGARKKRPRDFAQPAKMIVDTATAEIEDPHGSTPKASGTDPIVDLATMDDEQRGKFQASRDARRRNKPSSSHKPGKRGSGSK
jgi:hypothetical protein